MYQRQEKVTIPPHSGHVPSPVHEGQDVEHSGHVPSPVHEGQDVEHGGHVRVVVSGRLLQVLQSLLTEWYCYLVPATVTY